MSAITLTLKPVNTKDGVRKMSVLTTDTVESKLSEIRTLFDHAEDQEIKVIYSGKVLKNNETFENSGITSDTFVVIMAPKKIAKKEQPRASENNQVSVPAPAPVSTASGSNAQPPMQQTNNAAIPNGVTPNRIETYWNRAVPEADTQPLYSFERVYSILPQFTNFILETILTDPQLSVALYSGQTRMLMAESHHPMYENLVRQFLDQSQSIANSMRANTAPNVRIAIDPVTRQFLPHALAAQNNNHEHDHEHDDGQEQDHNYDYDQLPLPLPPLEELGEEGNEEFENLQNQLQQLAMVLGGQNGANMLNQLMANGQGQTIANGQGQTGGGFPAPGLLPTTLNQQPQTVAPNQQLSEDDEACVLNLIAVTGAPRHVVVSIYISCGKNGDLAYQLITGSMN